ncbi:hypothetical protein D3C77_331150 [compost metagenome]
MPFQGVEFGAGPDIGSKAHELRPGRDIDALVVLDLALQAFIPAMCPVEQGDVLVQCAQVGLRAGPFEHILQFKLQGWPLQRCQLLTQHLHIEMGSAFFVFPVDAA